MLLDVPGGCFFPWRGLLQVLRQFCRILSCPGFLSTSWGSRAQLASSRQARTVSASMPYTTNLERRKRPQELPDLVLLTAFPAWAWPAQVATSAGIHSGSGEVEVLWQLTPAALSSGELALPFDIRW